MEKQQLWERKLLDLSLRNNLVSLRTTKNLIPLLVPDLGPLEDALYNGQEFSIAPKPEQIPGVYPTDLGFDKLHQVDEWKEQLQDNKKIYAAMNRGELERSIVSLYRTARSSIEENGANTLYLSFGLLKWFDPKSPDKPRFAPLVLIPMEMVRKSAQSGYVIRQRDDEIQVNITLLELLKQDFGILIQNLDPIPQDDNGMDLIKLFEVFREHIRDQKDWEILDSACLGIFSFSQFVMWNDLRNRSDQLGENKLVRSLMDGQLSWGAEPMELPAKVEPESLLLPIPADASQLFAIQSALGGNSFVLHGPPGTGKSQTITGIIANALAQGKTVLFVAEKMAALSVVQKRMEKLGLGEFCLELHSNKSKKRDVLDQMMRATQVTSSHDPKTYQALAEQTGKLRQELDLYAKSLHQSQDSGFSFYQMIGEYEKEINAPDISLSEEYINTINPARYQEDLLQVEQLAAMTKALGDVSQDPLRRIQNPNYQLSMRESIPKAAKEYLDAIKDISPLYQELKQLLPMELPENQQKFEDFAEIIDAFGQWDAMPVSWANLDTASLYNIYETAEAATSLQTDKRLLSQKWKAQAFTSNAQNLLNQWREISAKGFIGKLFGQGKVVSEIQSLYGVELPKENIPAALEELILFQSKEQSLAENVEKYSPLLGELYQGKNTNWEQVFTLSQRARESLLAMGHVPNGNQLRAKLTGEYKNSVLSFVQKKEIFSQARQTLDALIHIQDVNSQDYLNSEADLAQALMDKTNYIKEWMQRSEKIAELQDRGILGAGKEMTALLPQEYVPGYKKMLFTKLITKTLQEDSALDRFSGAQFNQKIQQFKRLDEELSQLSKKEIFYRLAAQVPNFTKEASQSSELGILQRAMRSGGRGLSIRKLFEQIPNILPRICPCMLMSPISAAQYLDPSREPFDLVIFDEASQLPTSKAVGVLARGKESIVVGDPKQMPPTAFFTGENLDEENIETEDLESILEDCLALSMPQTHLLWHYRSRHESLIAFSNQQFYDSKLYTFPSANDQQKMVSFVPSNGVFDRGNTRTNEIEAKLVVKEILSRFQDPVQNKNSIGVVTFNMSQQSLIEDLLEAEYSKNPELDQWANTGEEPLFVKNLENVQGDERDVILFSIGFGPDSEGKIYMNFGPLNKDGGWRRLNVAITRSKKEMRVFSSLNPENIDLSKTQSQGVSALKGFLDYAKTGKHQGGMGVDAGDSQGIVKALQNYLEKAGFGSSAALGQSKFKIDLAVQDLQNPDQYLLGIMLDGPTYRDAKTTKDREVAPFGVLEGLGWRIHRIWSMDFWENPEKELDKLDKLLEAIQKGETVVETAVETVEETVKPVEAALPVEPSVESVEVATEPVKPVEAATTVEAVKPVEPVKPIDSDDSVIMPSTEQKKVDFKIQLQPYTAAKLPAKKQSAKTYVSEKNQGNITANILAMIEAEAPISEQLLTKKLLKSFGISRSRIEVQAETIRLLNALALPTTIQNGIRYFWTKNQDPENYHLLRQNGSDEDKRDVDQIVKTELQNALILVLQEQIAIPRDALIKEASKKLGYSRISENIKLFLDDALGQLETQGYIQQKGDMLQLW